MGVRVTGAEYIRNMERLGAEIGSEQIYIATHTRHEARNPKAKNSTTFLTHGHNGAVGTQYNLPQVRQQ